MANTTVSITATIIIQQKADIQPNNGGDGMDYKKPTIVASLLIVLAIVIIGGIKLISDNAGPTITVPENKRYYDGMTEEEILSGVKAYDKRDGDVTDSLIIEQIIKLNTGDGVQVIYVAQDNKNNITRKKVVLRYAGGNNVPEPTTEDSTEESTEGVTGEEPTNVDEGPTEGNTKPQDKPTVSGNVPGEPVTTDAEQPLLTLKEYETTVTKGTDVKWLTYVVDIVDDKDDRNDLFRRIMIRDYPDMNVPGDYIMVYYCTDLDSNKSPEAKLLVHVVE